MKASTVSLINGLILLVIGLYGYLGSDIKPVTALIPVIFGVGIISMNKGVKNENKLISHIVVILTLLILFGLIKPLLSAIERQDNMAILRVFSMFFSTLVSMVFFVKTFIRARKSK